MLRTILFCLGLAIATAGPVAAQTPQAPQAAGGDFRGYVSVNGGYQLAAADFTDGGATRLHMEDGRFDTTYVVKRGPAFDVSGGALIWRRLGVGAGISRFSVATPGALTAAVPHPFFFNRARAINGEVSGLTRDESAVHVQASVLLAAHPRVQVTVFGGPSFFQVKQGLVTGYTYADDYPYDEATFRSATTTTASKSKMGFNAGADAAFFFTRNLGVGGMVRFAGVSIPLAGSDGTTETMKAGGTQAGGGLRLRF